jgi:UDP-N-acetylglucosamine 4-epimerase
MQIGYDRPPIYRDFRAGDVRHSWADIAKAKGNLGYSPSHHVKEGIQIAMPWYVELFRAKSVQ